MDRFERPATEKTPYVVLDHEQGSLELRGCSIHDLDMLEAGEDFMGLLDLPVKLVEGT